MTLLIPYTGRKGRVFVRRAVVDYNPPAVGESCVQEATMSNGGDTLHAQCCIVGGGPAGMMLGFLLARAGVEVVVLEKHGDFLRDFRGDTIHPSTLEILHELGLLEEFLKRPHQEARQLDAEFGDERVTV